MAEESQNFTFLPLFLEEGFEHEPLWIFWPRHGPKIFGESARSELNQALFFHPDE